MPTTDTAPSTVPVRRQRTFDRPDTSARHAPGAAVLSTAVPPLTGVISRVSQSLPLMVYSKRTVPAVPDGAALADDDGETLALWLTETDALGEAEPDGDADALALADGDADGETDALGDRLIDVDPDGDADPDGEALPDGLPEMLPLGLTLALALAETDVDGETDAELSTA